MDSSGVTGLQAALVKYLPAVNLPRWQIPNEHWANFSCNWTAVKGCREASIACWLWCIVPAWKTGSAYVNGVWKPEGHWIQQKAVSSACGGRVKSIRLSPELWGYRDSKARPWSGNRTAETQYWMSSPDLFTVEEPFCCRAHSQLSTLLRAFSQHLYSGGGGI